MCNHAAALLLCRTFGTSAPPSSSSSNCCLWPADRGGPGGAGAALSTADGAVPVGLVGRGAQQPAVQRTEVCVIATGPDLDSGGA